MLNNIQIRRGCVVLVVLVVMVVTGYFAVRFLSAAFVEPVLPETSPTVEANVEPEVQSVNRPDFRSTNRAIREETRRWAQVLEQARAAAIQAQKDAQAAAAAAKIAEEAAQELVAPSPTEEFYTAATSPGSDWPTHE